MDDALAPKGFLGAGDLGGSPCAKSQRESVHEKMSKARSSKAGGRKADA